MLMTNKEIILLMSELYSCYIGVFSINTLNIYILFGLQYPIHNLNSYDAVCHTKNFDINDVIGVIDLLFFHFR